MSNISVAIVRFKENKLQLTLIIILTFKCFNYDVIAGRYEWPPSTYKHFYFNSTHSMLAVWLVVVVGIIFLYECVRAIIPLVYYSRCLLRREMLALFVSSLYPHYYGWWGLINYINEDFYAQWKHQVCDFLPLGIDDR